MKQISVFELGKLSHTKTTIQEPYPRHEATVNFEGWFILLVK